MWMVLGDVGRWVCLRAHETQSEFKSSLNTNSFFYHTSLASTRNNGSGDYLARSTATERNIMKAERDKSPSMPNITIFGGDPPRIENEISSCVTVIASFITKCHAFTRGCNPRSH